MKHSARAGISLLEVLISMFVLAIGVLSVASLVPVGQSEIVKGGIEDRKGALGQASYHEIVSRGWLSTMENPTPPYDDLTMFFTASGTGVVTRKNLNPNDPTYLGPVAIDPRSVAFPGNGTAVDRFPYTPLLPATTYPSMKRLTLRTHRSATAVALWQALADHILISHDDLTFVQPDDETMPAVGQFNDPDGNETTPDGTKRLFDPRYSYLFTLQPADADTFTLTIVIFRNRDPEFSNIAPSPDEPINEVMVQADLAGAGYGGGLALLKGPADRLRLRTGQYVMLSGFRAAVPPSTIPTPHFQWYRVINLDEIDASGTPQRLVGLSGPDWTGSSTSNLGCAIFAGAIGVYERTVRLEAPSPWTQE